MQGTVTKSNGAPPITTSTVSWQISAGSRVRALTGIVTTALLTVQNLFAQYHAGLVFCREIDRDGRKFLGQRLRRRFWQPAPRQDQPRGGRRYSRCFRHLGHESFAWFVNAIQDVGCRIEVFRLGHSRTSLRARR